MNRPRAVEIRGVSHRYDQRRALADVSLEIQQGEIFVFLGPNGGGKTTLFRLLSTLLPVQTGTIHVLGLDASRQLLAVRAALGVVFQSPSVDPKLTVAENVRCQAVLYGLRGRELRRRETELLAQLGLAERSRERVERLSGGLRRRVELAKGMLHRPRVLLLDEPSTGLDPAARGDLWQYLGHLRDEFGVTVILTSHLLEEAERADRIAILSEGQLVAVDTPPALRASVGGDLITIQCRQPGELGPQIQRQLGLAVQQFDGQLRVETPDGTRWLASIMEQFPGQVDSITLGKPTLEDVFIHRTGHRLWQPADQTR
ncbi:MAG: ABC transporter ATP-binding protein [Pirellulaceae bacterium]|nr:ABC transporter ATP-binding protein [Pirellulaceae bacterium]